jgi:hypothetical protein
MKARSFLIAIMAAACVSACDESNELGPELSAEQRALNDNMALWQRANIASYQYTYRRQCFCAIEEDIVVVVVNGQVSQAFRTPSGIYLTAQELPSVFPIEGLFSKVQEAIDRRVFSLRVVYNASYSYPELIAIDGIQNLADDEITYTARDLQ